MGFGLQVFRSDVSGLHEAEGAKPKDKPRSLARTILSTFALTITNPATLFGFTALFAGLASITMQEPSFVDAAVMVAGVIAGSVSWWFMLTTFVGIFHRHIDNGVMRAINHVFGVLVSGFGVAVLGNLAVRLI